MIRIGVIEDEARMREEVCRYVEKTAGDFAEIQCRAYESAEQFLEENSGYQAAGDQRYRTGTNIERTGKGHKASLSDLLCRVCGGKLPCGSQSVYLKGKHGPAAA